MSANFLLLAFDVEPLSRMPKRIAVAWSGGADSTALLFLLKAKGYDVCAWHVDHGWSAESAVLCENLARMARDLSLPFYSKKIKKPKSNLEAESRKLRYKAFSELALQTSIFDVALGHHANDQAETVCMRLLQGAGVAGCRGMKSVRQMEKLQLWRPMLEISRSSIEEFLQKNQMVWSDDPSNQDNNIWRNKIRNQLFPEMAKAGVAPALLFLRIQKMAAVTQAQIEVLAKNILVSQQVNAGLRSCSVVWQDWESCPQAVRAYVLQKMIGILFADGKVFGRRHIEAIEQWKTHGGNGWVSLSGCYLCKQNERLQLYQDKKEMCL